MEARFVLLDVKDHVVIKKLIINTIDITHITQDIENCCVIHLSDESQYELGEWDIVRLISIINSA